MGQVVYLSENIGHDDQNEIFAEFDKLSNDLKKSSDSDTVYGAEAEKLTPLQQRRQSRKERLEEQKSGKPLNIFIGKLKSVTAGLAKAAPKLKPERAARTENDMSKKKAKRKRYRINIKKLILAAICLFLLCGIAASAYVYSIIKDAPEIDPSNIYSMLAENSVVYDSSGEIIDSIYNSPDGKRTNIAFADMPEDLYDAFIAVEDKTFWEHSGFNIVRMIGAVRDSLFGGGKISGTSTITQQLARNLYLPDSRYIYSFKRKILEAYYTVVIEKQLTKQQIIEAYLNTIYLGFNSSGVQAASQAYFSKDVEELDLVECVALAAIPQLPSVYAPVKSFGNDEIADNADNIIFRGTSNTYVYNGESSSDRRNLILKFMKEQGYIDDARYEAALSDDLRNHIHPYTSSGMEYSSYFTDYVIDKVIEDLMKTYGYSIDEAKRDLYNKGLRIYSTLDTGIQKIIETEFADNANYPGVANLKKDSAGNILNPNGNILLYAYGNYFDESGNFTLSPDEYEKMPDGSLKLLEGKRLSFYRTEVQGNVDYSIEFKNMYTVNDKIFYSIGGGFVSIAREYKDKDADGNLIISAKFFDDQPGFFSESDKGLTISSGDYSLRQSVVQPQSAMVVTDYKTGYIKAMVGGRNTVGRLLFNRANSPRQPGSSIKPMGVYGPALQLGLDTLNGGSTQTYTNFDEAAPDEGAAPDGDTPPAANLYGKYWTAASVIDDAPIISDGKSWPKNWYSGYSGLFTLRSAVEQSVNVCAVKVFQQIGADYSYQFLKKLGVTSIVDSGSVNDMNPAALALGGMTKGISPLEMAGGYGAFANQGVYVEPIAYEKVTNKYGEVLLNNTPITTQVMDPGVAFIMTDILRSTVTSGIANHAAIGIQPVAGKTGTTTDNFDAWFVGLTPQYAAALWIGNDISIELSQGSVSASKLWSKIMKQVCAGLPAGSFPAAPDDVISVTIDTKSGMLPSDLSALDPQRWTIRSEYFIKGTEPTEVDNVHTFVTICRETGYLATPLCNDCVSAFGVRRPYVPDPSVADIIYEVPHYYCYLHNPDPAEYPINEEALWNYNWNGMEITEDLPEDLTDELNESDASDGSAPPDGSAPDGSDDLAPPSGESVPGPGVEPEPETDNPDPGFNYDDMPANLRP